MFKHVEGGVDYRTVGWPRASVIFLKVIFATGVLSIPSAMVSLGAVGGAICLIGWGAINTYTATTLGKFRNSHPGCHTVADMAYHVGGAWFRELVGALYLIAYTLCAGTGILGTSIGINALSSHAACTVWWSFIATVAIALMASFPKFHQIGWLTWAVSEPPRNPSHAHTHSTNTPVPCTSIPNYTDQPRASSPSSSPSSSSSAA